MSKGSLLLSGATGIMGSWVLGEALARGYEPIVLMRDSDINHAIDRLAAVLEHAGRLDDLSKVRVVMGDARHPLFGLKASEAAELRRATDRVVHCAACTSFDPSQDEECWATNVGGVANVVDFISGTDIPLFHVSTAYVAGKRRERVFEGELGAGRGFNNTYERSKHTSETMIRQAFAEERLRGAIFRPSIIVGSTEDGRISQFMNFYGLLRILDVISNRRAKGERVQFRMKVSPESTLNLIPVDWTARALWQIIEAEGPSGQAYHLTNPGPPAYGEILVWANELLAPSGVMIRLVDEFDSTPSSLEAIFANQFENYGAYMRGEAHFDRTNTDRALNGSLPFPRFDAPFFDALLGYAREVRWRSLFDAHARREERPRNVCRFRPVAVAGKGTAILACDAGAGA